MNCPSQEFQIESPLQFYTLPPQQGGALFDLPLRRSHRERPLSPAPLECTDRSSEGAATADARRPRALTLFQTLEASSGSLGFFFSRQKCCLCSRLALSTTDWHVCVATRRASLFYPDTFAWNVRRARLLAEVASAHSSFHHLQECWCTPLALGALLGIATSLCV